VTVDARARRSRWVRADAGLDRGRVGARPAQDDDNWDYYVDPDSKIGYIRLTQFQKYTAAT
jgi:hypothetical protein